MSSKSVEELCWRYIEDGDIRKAQECIINGANTDKLLDSGISIIHLLSSREGTQNNRLLDLCLDYGASPNVPTLEGITPVHLASIWENHENLCTLLKYHGDPEITDVDGLNALDYAFQSEEPQTNLCLEHLSSIMIESSPPKTSYSIMDDTDSSVDELNSGLMTDDGLPDNTTFSANANTSDCGLYQERCVQQHLKPISSNKCLSSHNAPTSMHAFDSDRYNESCAMQLERTTVNKDPCPSKTAYATDECSSYSPSIFPSLQVSKDADKTDETYMKSSNANKNQKKKYTRVKCNKNNYKSLTSQDHMAHDLAPSSTTKQHRNGLAQNPTSKTDNGEVYTCSKSNKSLEHSNTIVKPNHDYDHLKDRNDVSHDFTASFHTAFQDMTLTGGLDDTVVSFPKLHPWTITNSNADLDDTVLDLGRDFQVSPNKDNTNNDTSNVTILYDWKEYSILETSCCDNPDSTLLIPKTMMAMSCDQIKKELIANGDDPGPVRADTRMLYLRRLVRLTNGQDECQTSDKLKEYLPEVRGIIEGRLPSPEMLPAEESMCVEFTKKNLRDKWREGTEKSSFNYLLLDPRVTQNLPLRSRNMVYEDIFHTFVAAVFYVGKGKRSRPYAHLYEAAKKSKDSRKLNQIRDIWSAGLGVVSLHFFQGVIPVEAYTREACIIDALGLHRLTNKKRGDYYGRAKSWSQKKKREMGVYLIKRALQIFLNEGERQMRPEDLKTKS